jgi:hypothetical protein
VVSRHPVHLQDRVIAEVIEPEAGPWPLLGRGGQALFHGIGMHVAQLFQAFFLAGDSKRIEAALPDSVGGLVMHGGRETQPGRHFRAPRGLGVLAEQASSAESRLAETLRLLTMKIICCLEIHVLDAMHKEATATYIK